MSVRTHNSREEPTLPLEWLKQSFTEYITTHPRPSRLYKVPRPPDYPVTRGHESLSSRQQWRKACKTKITRYRVDKRDTTKWLYFSAEHAKPKRPIGESRLLRKILEYLRKHDNADTAYRELELRYHSIIREDVRHVWKLLHQSPMDVQGPRSTRSPAVSEADVQELKQLRVDLERFQRLRSIKRSRSLIDEGVARFLELSTNAAPPDLQSCNVCTIAESVKQIQRLDRAPFMLIRDARGLNRIAKRDHKTFFTTIGNQQDTAIVDYSRRAGNWGGRSMQTIRDVLPRLRESRADRGLASFGASDSVAGYIDPMAGLHFRCPESDVKPLCLIALASKERFNLLEDIHGTLVARNFGIDAKQVVSDFLGIQGYALFSQQDAITLPHHDHHGVTTWITVVTGRKLWVFWPEIDDDERAEFAREGQNWTGGRPKYVILNAGDTIIMEPGLVHSVITLQDSLCYGGSVWDRSALPKIMDSIAFETQFKERTTNENKSNDLPEAIGILRERVRSEKEQGGISTMPGTDTDSFQQQLDSICDFLKVKDPKKRTIRPSRPPLTPAETVRPQRKAATKTTRRGQKTPSAQ